MYHNACIFLFNWFQLCWLYESHKNCTIWLLPAFKMKFHTFVTALVVAAVVLAAARADSCPKDYCPEDSCPQVSFILICNLSKFYAMFQHNEGRCLINFFTLSHHLGWNLKHGVTQTNAVFQKLTLHRHGMQIQNGTGRTVLGCTGGRLLGAMDGFIWTSGRRKSSSSQLMSLIKPSFGRRVTTIDGGWVRIHGFAEGFQPCHHHHFLIRMHLLADKGECQHLTTSRSEIHPRIIYIFHILMFF